MERFKALLVAAVVLALPVQAFAGGFWSCDRFPQLCGDDHGDGDRKGAPEPLTLVGLGAGAAAIGAAVIRKRRG